MLSFTRLLSLPSLLAHFSLSCPITPFSILMPAFRPFLLLFIHPYSLPPSFPPSRFSSLPPADDSWCDEDWLRESQREETAGRVETEKAVRRGKAWEGWGWGKQRRKMLKTTWDRDGERQWENIQRLYRYVSWHIGIHGVQHSTNNNANHNMHTRKRTWWDAARSLCLIMNLMIW